MIRVVAESVLLFLIPFLCFGAYLLARRRDPVAVDAWTGGTVATLSLGGLALAAMGILLFGLLEERPTGAYLPAHLESGRLVPGHFE